MDSRAGFAGAGSAATISVRDLWTSSQTFCWSLSAIASLRTLGCAIWALNELKLSAGYPRGAPPPVLATQRPGSTQKTLRSMGSLLGGTMRSLPTTRSCLPPVTISPASRISGRSELLTSIRRLTCAPSPHGIIGRSPSGTRRRRRIKGAMLPASVTTTSPERRPSSSVRKLRVSWDRPAAATTGKIVRLAWVMGGSAS